MKNIVSNFNKIFQILTTKQRKFFRLVILLTFISILLDLIGIGLFIPIINFL